MTDILKVAIAYFECACDSDSNLKVTWEEVQEADCRAAQDFASNGNHFTKAKFDADDKNGDGVISIDEYAKIIRERWENGFP